MTKIQVNSSGKAYVANGKALAAKEFGTKSITQNGTYAASSDSLDGYSSVTVNVSGGGGSSSRAIKANYWIDTNGGIHNIGNDTSDSSIGAAGGVLSANATSISTDEAFIGAYGEQSEFMEDVLKVDLSALTSLSNSAFSETFKYNSSLTSVDLSSLTNLTAGGEFFEAFHECESLTSVDLSSLTSTADGSNFLNAFNGTALTTISFPNLTTVSAYDSFAQAFADCSNLTSASFPVLTTLSGERCFGGIFIGTSLISVSFPSLTTITGEEAMAYAFSYCNTITTVSFPALTAQSFGNYTNQFNRMITNCENVTVHFPSNLQSVIGDWEDVLDGFGGTNTTVLFDLTAT